MKSGFDFIAPVYDFLKRLVFGNTLENAISSSINVIQPDDQVLIVGGGTGKILDSMQHVKEIDFMDVSSVMISRSKKHKSPGIRFINQDFLEGINKKYDIIMFPFFLDVFGPENLQKAIAIARKSLNQGGKLLVIDFQKSGHIWNDLLIRLMYLFFHNFLKMEGSRMLIIHDNILKAGFSEKSHSFFRRKMIFCRIYQLSETL